MKSILNSVFQASKYPFCYLPMFFLWILQILTNLIDTKGNFLPGDSDILKSILNSVFQVFKYHFYYLPVFFLWILQILINLIDTKENFWPSDSDILKCTYNTPIELNIFHSTTSKGCKLLTTDHGSINAIFIVHFGFA